MPSQVCACSRSSCPLPFAGPAADAQEGSRKPKLVKSWCVGWCWLVAPASGPAQPAFCGSARGDGGVRVLRAPWLLPAPWSSAFLQEAAGFLLTLGFFFLCPEEWFFFFFF